MEESQVKTRLQQRRPGAFVPLHDYLPLVLFVIVSTVTPGGATTLATASGAHFGYRRSLPLMAGIAAGLASMAAAAAAGLGSVLLALPALQLAMRAAGSAYLMWLAVRIGRGGKPRLDVDVHRPQGFVSGVWMLWHNPKGWAMTLGAAASFAALASGPARLGVLLGFAFGVAAMASLSLWCFAGLLFARVLRTERQWRCLNAGLGVLLAASIVPMWLP
ncbi:MULTISPECIES: LysE family translocator [Burkholderia]|uniref:LysE family translocator n=1 Tax=Burkholderia TaxID=32008 RepID=UPI0015D50CA7|nr:MULTISPECIES: LysE family transporter [Burkholderia]MDF3094244.1 LysE family transporter [Burkholderia semiarida]MDF3105155.1 LysE family transporter [Burkholderia semiarida]